MNNLTKEEIKYEKIFNILSKYTTQTLDYNGFATYTFDDEDRDDLIEELMTVK